MLLSAEGVEGNLWNPRRFQIISLHDVDSVRMALQNVRSLHLNFEVSGDTLEHFLRLMPNATSISLAYGDERFYPLPSLGSLLKPGRMFTRLDLSGQAFSDDYVIPIVRKHSRTLRDLRLDARGVARILSRGGPNFFPAGSTLWIFNENRTPVPEPRLR